MQSPPFHSPLLFPVVLTPGPLPRQAPVQPGVECTGRDVEHGVLGLVLALRDGVEAGRSLGFSEP